MYHEDMSASGYAIQGSQQRGETLSPFICCGQRNACNARKCFDVVTYLSFIKRLGTNTCYIHLLDLAIFINTHVPYLSLAIWRGTHAEHQVLVSSHHDTITLEPAPAGRMVRDAATFATLHTNVPLVVCEGMHARSSYWQGVGMVTDLGSPERCLRRCCVGGRRDSGTQRQQLAWAGTAAASAGAWAAGKHVTVT